MTDKEMEEEIDAIVDKHFPVADATRNWFKLSILEAYLAGMEVVKKVYAEVEK